MMFGVQLSNSLEADIQGGYRRWHTLVHPEPMSSNGLLLVDDAEAFSPSRVRLLAAGPIWD